MDGRCLAPVNRQNRMVEFSTGSAEEPHLFLSHQRDLQIGGPVFRLIKSPTVHVFTPIKKHVVVDINEVVVDIGLSFHKAKQRKGFSCDVLHDIDLPLIETIAWKSVRDIGKALMQ